MTDRMISDVQAKVHSADAELKRVHADRDSGKLLADVQGFRDEFSSVIARHRQISHMDHSKPTAVHDFSQLMGAAQLLQEKVKHPRTFKGYPRVESAVDAADQRALKCTAEIIDIIRVAQLDIARLEREIAVACELDTAHVKEFRAENAKECVAMFNHTFVDMLRMHLYGSTIAPRAAADICQCYFPSTTEAAAEQYVKKAEQALAACVDRQAQIMRVGGGHTEYPRLLTLAPGPKNAAANMLGRVVACSTFSEAIRDVVMSKAYKRLFPTDVLKEIAEYAFACRFPSSTMRSWLRMHTCDDDPWASLVAARESTHDICIGERGRAAVASVFTSAENAAVEEALMCCAYEAICVRCIHSEDVNPRKVSAPKRVRRRKYDDDSESD